MKRKCLAVFIALIAAVFCFSQDNFIVGEDLFMQNKPREAAPYLENAIAADPSHVMAHLYLGIAYEQTGRIDEAISVYRQILGRAGSLAATTANNLGNAYFKQGSLVEAEAMYSQAITTDSIFAPAYLGRANARIQRGSLTEAIQDYEQYLMLNPNTGQRGTIERLVSYVRTEIAEAERQRVIAEELARQEAERRQRLLDEVSASLQGAAGASQGLSAGAEDVIGYDGEFELE